jgi:endonuclease III
MVNRVAKRLGWVTTNDPDETIKFLSQEAEEMKENVYKYLESLAQLGGNFCHKDDPSCPQCPMGAGCRYNSSHNKKSQPQPQKHGLGLFKRDKPRAV